MTGLPDGDGAGEAGAGEEGVALAADAAADADAALAEPDGPEDARLGLTATLAPGEALAPHAPTSRDAAASATNNGDLRRADRGPLSMSES
jgi:hypothetical protein